MDKLHRKCSVVFCSHAISDPLISLLILDYLKRLQRTSVAMDILLFTEERTKRSKCQTTEKELKGLGIKWIPLHYDVRSRQWRQKIKNIFLLWYYTQKFVRGYDSRHLIGFLSMAGGYAALFGLFIPCRTITICFEPHSMYMLELGLWSRFSLKYIMVSMLERLQVLRTTHLIVPTTAVQELVKSKGRRKGAFLLPITIDVDKATFNSTDRENIRRSLGWEGRTVISYTGKFGGIYYSHRAYLRFMSMAFMADENIRFLIIAPEDDVEQLHALLHDHPLSKYITLRPAMSAIEMTRYLSASDFGVIGIPPAPSQAFRTPVKTAFYWAAGLPLIIPYGVSDDHVIASEENIGIVVKDLPGIEPIDFANQIKKYQAMDEKSLKLRCMSAARRYRDTPHMVELLRKLIIA